MKKILYILGGLLAGILLSTATLVFAHQENNSAWMQEVARDQVAVTYRFEWYGDVCYVAEAGNTGNGGNVGISCLKH